MISRLGALLYILSSLALPLGSLRPLRILSGVPVWWIWEFPLLLSLPLLGGLGAFWSTKVRWPSWSQDILGALMFLLVLGCLGLGAETLRTEAGPLSRVALGWGTGISFLGILLWMGRFPGLLFWGFGLLGSFILGILGILEDISLYQELLLHRQTLLRETGSHLLLTFSAVGLSLVPSLVLGWILSPHPKLEGFFSRILSLGQTIPTLVLFSLSMVVFQAVGLPGVGFSPSLAILTLYSAFPLFQGAGAARKSLPPGLVEAIKGLGFRGIQGFFAIELPTALPIFLASFRTAIIQTIGNTTLAGLLGGGGLGSLLFLSLAQGSEDGVLLIAMVIASLVILTAQGLNKWEILINRKLRRFP